ncbi:MAG: sugar phosphate isomerase/epimerase [Candidatus Sumerlaeota bacterium]|nr:sugar phosphate isomerase/epimerase [Candidatus Sumerlaeota bacterium]
MSDFNGEFYIGTILLEPNRWATGKTPTYRVSEWIERFRAAGFDGMELWENHAALADAKERKAIVDSGFPAAVFNSYCNFGDEAEGEWRRAAELARELNAQGVKFNFGKDPARRDADLRNIRRFRDLLPENCRALCECHPGTLAETPAQAAALFDALGRERFEAIVHPFRPDTDELRDWLRRLGPRITHVHVQIREGAAFVRLDQQADLAQEGLRILREEGFAGSFTLEFTSGVRAPREDVERLFAGARRDLAFLREHWG